MRDVMNGRHITLCLIHHMNGHRYSWQLKCPGGPSGPISLASFLPHLGILTPLFPTNCIILFPLCLRLFSQQKFTKSQIVRIKILN
jgi:hypothetical protein